MTRTRILFRLLKRILLALFLLHLLYLVLLRWVFPPLTLTQLGDLMRGQELQRTYVRLEAISPAARLAVLAAEDQRFPEHRGFDWKSIQQALEHNERLPNRVRGASTLSQQTAKNVFLWQGRSWLRKGLEAYCTVLIETFWGKRRILELYLNVAEMGPGIYGIEAAARHYYNKPAARLTATEAARIAACLPNPKRYRVQPPDRYVQRRSAWILQQMRNLEGDPAVKGLLTREDQKRKYDSVKN
ncbi:MAG TPA: monofunctional biosynthetic peptidoglycan transglycosylase [Lacibacter sp.]|nr:monofunctional biosynthetic peptidoglycan transglycosylase [Lacibacter sp.]HMO90451.1 monofunctional biosynthetic peptidoglycan transglycosylase [Lacibacter sp.]HMP88252.1 monofunctional biosynthetic peptidoglycan transglycosylase [Lacibacter sp.]